MAINKVNGNLVSAIGKVQGVSNTAIDKINGQDIGDGGPIVNTWCAVAKDGYTSWAESSDYTSWTEYRVPSNSKDDSQVAYGQDGSGNIRWVKSRNQANGEIYYTSDPQDGSGGWTKVNTNASVLFDVAWGDGVWIAVGKANVSGYNKNIIRSTDGASWTSISLASISGVTTHSFRAIASDGNGTWLLPQEDRIYKSTDGGLNWALTKDYNDDRTIKDICYTTDNNDVGVWATVDQSEKFSVALATDTTSWTSTTIDTIGSSVQTIGAGGGTFIAANSNDIVRSADTGQTWTFHSNVLAYGTAREIATDGNGNWIDVHDDGGISYSTDDGLTWSSAADTGNEDYTGICASVHLPV
jgi:hypothetical protein